MIDIILSCLKTNSDISAYEVSMDMTKSVQLFYVLNKLETNRYTSNNDILVNIYHDHDGYRGNANFTVNSADNLYTINDKIERALKIAKTINNKFFNLNSKNGNVENIESIKEYNLNKVATKCMDAVVKADVYDDGWINSTEIFVTEKRHSYLNSAGVMQSYQKTFLEIELIPTWRNQAGEEFELYLDFSKMDDDYKDITRRVSEVLKMAKLRSEAIPFDHETMPYLGATITSGMMKTFLSCFVFDVNYANVYSKGNHYNVGDKLGNAIDLTLKAQIKGASRSCPFDESGICLNELKLIENGEIINLWGSNRFGQYLGIENPSGTYRVFEFESSNTFNDLEKPYFELIEFSLPQLDAASGYFGGEVRLALYHGLDGRAIPVSGLSLSGNAYKAINSAKFSSEKVTYANYHGPKTIYFDNIEIH